MPQRPQHEKLWRDDPKDDFGSEEYREDGLRLIIERSHPFGDVRIEVFLRKDIASEDSSQPQKSS